MAAKRKAAKKGASGDLIISKDTIDLRRGRPSDGITAEVDRVHGDQFYQASVNFCCGTFIRPPQMGRLPLTPKFSGFRESLKMTSPALLEPLFALLPRKERL